jgi:hypothetical protein
VAIAEGAHFRGSVDMQRKSAAAGPTGAGASKAATPQAATPQQTQNTPQRVGA